jgi:hypothetical protein
MTDSRLDGCLLSSAGATATTCLVRQADHDCAERVIPSSVTFCGALPYRCSTGTLRTQPDAVTCVGKWQSHQLCDAPKKENANVRPTGSTYSIQVEIIGSTVQGFTQYPHHTPCQVPSAAPQPCGKANTGCVTSPADLCPGHAQFTYLIWV